MSYTLSQVIKAFDKLNLDRNKRIEFIEALPKIRTDTQRKSIELFCKIIAEQFNEIGQTFSFTGVKGKIIEIPYSQTIVKECMWKPIQEALFDKKSTTKLTTSEVSQVAEPLIKFFADLGIIVKFPSRDSLKYRNEY